jgi:hypothetical protein
MAFEIRHIFAFAYFTYMHKKSRLQDEPENLHALALGYFVGISGTL